MFHTQKFIEPEENIYSNYQSRRCQCASHNIDILCWNIVQI